MKKIKYKNIIFIIGQNAKENWDIFDENKKINNNFIWFHLNSFPSPYVIMQSTFNDIDKSQIYDILTYGANLCKENSKYTFLNDLKIIYCQLNKLTKTNKLGEVYITGKKYIIKI
jgi:predicted ribosome quality control (RQC) complex YloA/Tae2 family protein